VHRRLRDSLLLLAFALLLGALRSEAAPRNVSRAEQYCSFCGVADPYAQSCFYYGQPCGGDPSCYCGFCGSKVACLQ